MTYINITKFLLINLLEKDHSIIETRRLKNVVIFIQTILGFVQSRKVINIYNDITRKYENHSTFTVAVVFKKPETVSFASSIVKNNVAPATIFRFLVKLICCVAFGSGSRFCCFLKSFTINL